MGDVEVAIDLKPDGAIDAIRYPRAARPSSQSLLLHPEIEGALRRSRFGPRCDAAVTVVFEFRLLSNVDDNYRAVTYAYPNPFEIAASSPTVQP
jgi:hypothetical protein